MKRSIVLAVVAGALGSCLGACSGRGGGDESDFDNFVHGVVAQTSETSEPVDINGLEFDFSEDPAAFDDLFQ